MSMSQSAVANKLRLLKLSYEEQRMILESGLTERHARAALRLDNPQRRASAIRDVSENKMNVQSFEEYIERILNEEEISARRSKEISKAVSDDFRSEKELMEMVRSLRKKVDLWNKEGKTVNIAVANEPSGIEIRIKIAK